jgi:hypothetical protein
MSTKNFALQNAIKNKKEKLMKAIFFSIIFLPGRDKGDNSMRRLFISAIITAILIFMATPSHAFWWMIYHKPAFKGKVIDAETKEPIEGAVVVAVYSKTSYLGIVESYSVAIDVKETLTDKNGEFYLPSYTTIIHPFSSEDMANFIIFKSGYGSFPNYRITPPMKLSLPAIEEFFSNKTGTEGEIGWDYKTSQKIKVTFGTVELPKLNTREERLDAKRSADIFGLTITAKDLPILYKIISEENKDLGLK